MKEREMKDSGIPWIGEIPKDWEKLTFKYSGSFQKGKLPININNEGIGKPIIGASEMLGKPARQYSIDEGLPECNKDDILILWDGANAGIVSNAHEGIVSSTATTYSCKDKRCYPQYVFYLFKSVEPYFRDKVFGTTIPHMNIDYINDVPLLLPSIIEQKEIAEFLDRKCGEIDELVDIQDKMIEELKAYKQSIITETVTKGLYPNVPLKDSGIKWIGEIPQHWETIRLKEGFRLRTGTTPKDFEKGLDYDSLINWFTPSDIAEMNCELNKSERHLSKEVINKEGILLNPIGTLIFVGIGASAGKIGYSLIESYSNQQITNLIPKENKIIGKYAYYYLLADRKRIRDNSFFTTLPIINNSYLSTIKILTPTLSEQQEIADFLDKKCSEIDCLIDLKQQKIEELKDYKKSIIYEYVTGKKQVEINKI